MRIVFMGTPDYAVPSLEKLINSKHEILAVVTQPDRPRGRSGKLSFCPVKEVAVKNNLKVLQYEKISREGVEDLQNLNPDVVLTVAFGQILSQKVLDIPKYGVINSHASLLPKYRGSAPIQWAVLNGEKETGVTIMKTALKVDSGDILLQRKIKILENETSGELFDRLSVFASDVLMDALDIIESGNAKFIPQNHEEATHFPMLKKQDGLINFNCTVDKLNNFVNGMNPWPCAFFYNDDKMYKVHKVEKFEGNYQGYNNGVTVIADSKKGWIIKVEDGLVNLKIIQPQNSKKMNSMDYLRGHSITKG